MATVRIRNRGKLERGPYVARYTAGTQTADKVVRPGARLRKDAPAEIGKGRHVGSICFGAAGTATDTIDVDERDLKDSPLGRALANSRDTLVRVKDDSK